MSEMLMARDAYGDLLVELGTKHPEIVVLDADLSSSTKTIKFAKKFPDRFFNCGVAEQNMMGVAAGLASEGKIPFVSTFAIFGSGRGWDQVRNSICASEMNVKIVVTHGGISVGPDGLSHQALEDMALMRAIPTMVIICPCDTPEAVAAIRAAFAHKGPIYVRLGRPKVPSIWKGKEFKIGKAEIVQEGKDVTIVCCGIMVNEALLAKELLEKKGIHPEIINMSTIKPLDEKALLESVKKTGCVVTCEEHNIIGGLGSAVSEVLSEKYPVPLKRVGIQDRFGQSGDPEELMVEYSITKDDIANTCLEIIKRKK